MNSELVFHVCVSLDSDGAVLGGNIAWDDGRGAGHVRPVGPIFPAVTATQQFEYLLDRVEVQPALW